MKAVYYHVALPIILALIVNIWLFRIGYDKRSLASKVNPWIPSGKIIALIWTLLLGLLGYVHYLVKESTVASISVIAYILWSIAYPFLSNVDNAVLLNKLSFAFAVILTIIVNSVRKNTVKYMVPLLLWISYVNIVY